MRDLLVRLRPRSDTLYTSQGRSVLAAHPDGFLHDGVEHGFFFHETRLLSRYRYLIDGRPLKAVALSNVQQHSWLGYYITFPPGAAAGEPDRGSGSMQPDSEYTIELRLSRYIGGGFHEDVDLRNFTRETSRFDLTLQVDADFADLIETKGERQQFGELRREWRQQEEGVWELSFDYRAEHAYSHHGESGHSTLHRGAILRIEHSDTPPSRTAADEITFRVELGPGASWHACINLVPVLDGVRTWPKYGCRSFFGIHNEFDRKRTAFLGDSMQLTGPESHTLAPVVVAAFERAKHDLASLRLYHFDHGDRSWVPAAGLPIYLALFGRDSLTAGWQAGLATVDMMRGAARELVRWQGVEVDDWRDEQPGKMLHEAHTGPLAVLNFNPRARYYGSITTSGFFPVVVSELWRWTGDRDEIAPLIEPALKGLEWLDTYGDLDGDGLYEYKSRSTDGVKHQAWKDSGDAIVYEDGGQVEPPIATCEEQGFAFMAKVRMSEVLWWLDRKEESRRLFDSAMELKERFNAAFWMEDLGYFALGLDADKRQIRSITSNPGHCLATAIVEKRLAEQTARRMFAPDLFTGWGIRTLSSDHPAYNPYSYHRGSVWPVEHGTFAMAFMRYGLHDLVERISEAQFRAAALFDHYRLPELFSGHAQDEEHPFPALYPQANSPQAWSASAIICFIQALTGVYPYAPLSALLVDPQLPEWLPEITLSNLHVGDASVTLRFFRKPDGASDYRVLDLRGRLHVIRQPSPWSLTATPGERIKDTLLSLVPGR